MNNSLTRAPAVREGPDRHRDRRGAHLPRFSTSSTRLRSPSVAVSIRLLAPFLTRNPGTGATRSTVSSKRTRVESPSGVERVPTLLRALLFGADQGPAHAVVVDGVCQLLFVADADELDDLSGSGRVVLVVALEHFDLLVRRRPLGQRLDVEQHIQDFVGRRLDDDFAGIGDSHVREIAGAVRLETRRAARQGLGRAPTREGLPS